MCKNFPNELIFSWIFSKQQQNKCKRINLSSLGHFFFACFFFLFLIIFSNGVWLLICIYTYSVRCIYIIVYNVEWIFFVLFRILLSGFSLFWPHFRFTCLVLVLVIYSVVELLERRNLFLADFFLESYRDFYNQTLAQIFVDKILNTNSISFILLFNWQWVTWMNFYRNVMFVEFIANTYPLVFKPLTNSNALGCTELD